MRGFPLAGIKDKKYLLDCGEIFYLRPAARYAIVINLSEPRVGFVCQNHASYPRRLFSTLVRLEIGF